ncbi:MAG: peptidoglycan-binding domain-containing protein [Candidatus Omnitrophota bacterium]
MSKRLMCVLIVSMILVASLYGSVFAMGRKIKPVTQPPSLELNQPEIELIKPEELVPPSPISEELKESGAEEIATQLAPDEATKNRQIQSALKNAGYDPGTVDGKIGSKTKKAIKEFQSANDLKVDGRVGSKTWSKLSAYLVKEK